MPPHHAAGTVTAIPATQNQRGALWRNSIIANAVNAIWIAPMITASRTSEPRASQAVTYPPQATQKSLTCNLYNEAQSVCGAVPDRAALCAAVFAAMDANRPLGPQGAAIHDPIDAFLLATQELVADSAKSRIADLRQMNTRLLQELGEAQEKERRAAQGNTWLSDHCAYAPTAIELRDAFGCTAQGAATAQCPTQPVACL